MQGYYYNDDVFPTGPIDPVATPAALRKVEPDLDVVWASNPGPEITGDIFKGHFEGRLKPSLAGDYTFRCVVDDDLRLWIDGVLLIDDQSTGASSHTAIRSVAMVPEQMYTIVADYRDTHGGAALQLFWACTAVPDEPVPAHSCYLPKK